MKSQNLWRQKLTPSKAEEYSNEAMNTAKHISEQAEEVSQKPMLL